jgi:hypothetical protein
METLMEVCDDYSEKLRAQDELKKMPKLQAMLLDGISHHSTYLSEVRHDCECMPPWLKGFMKCHISHAWMNRPGDEHFLSFEDVRCYQDVSSVVTNEQ